MAKANTKAKKTKGQKKTAKPTGPRPWPRWYVYSKVKKTGKLYQANTYTDVGAANKRANELKADGYDVTVSKRDGPTRGTGPRKPAKAKGHPGRKPRAKPAKAEVEEDEESEDDESEDEA